MIFGAHILFYSQDPEAEREFFSDVLGFRLVDVGHGRLIFARLRQRLPFILPTSTYRKPTPEKNCSAQYSI